MASIMFSLDIVFAQPKAHGAVEGSADRPTGEAGRGSAQLRSRKRSDERLTARSKPAPGIIRTESGRARF
jgi:hypothetical protein